MSVEFLPPSNMGSTARQSSCLVKIAPTSRNCIAVSLPNLPRLERLRRIPLRPWRELIWRKRNLATIRTAELARKRYAEIISPPKGSDGAPNDEDSLEKILRMLGFSDGENLEQGSTPPRAGEDLSPSSTNVDFTAEREKERQFTEEKARKELGETYRLVEIGEAATFDALRQDLDIEERLDGMIDKCLKRLLHLRALKSISASTPAPRLRLAEHPKLIQRPS